MLKANARMYHSIDQLYIQEIKERKTDYTQLVGISTKAL